MITRNYNGSIPITFFFGNRENSLDLQKISHYQKFSPVLQDIRRRQQPEEVLDLMDRHLENVSFGILQREQKPSCITQMIHFNNQGEKALVTSFVDDATVCASRIAVKDPVNKWVTFKQEFIAIGPNRWKGLKAEGFEFPRPLEQHPFFQQSVCKFLTAITPDSYEVLGYLISYSNCSEFLTSFCVDERIALTLGAKMFVSLYGVLKQPGNLTYFLCSVKRVLWWNQHLVFSKCVTFLIKYKYTIVTTTTVFTGWAVWWWGLKGGKVAATVAVVPVPPMTLEEALPSSKSRRDGFLLLYKESKKFTFLFTDFIMRHLEVFYDRVFQYKR